MKTNRLSVLLLTTGLFLFSGVITAPASAQGQSDAELRRDNQRLRTEVDELKKELNAAKAQIKKLEKMIADLRKSRSRSTGQPSDPPEKEKVSIDETKPLASPRSIFTSLQSSYKEAMSEMDMGEEEDSRERSNYLRALGKWVKSTTRSMAKPVEWEVTIESSELKGDDFALKLQAVDPKYGTKLGEPFWASLKKKRARNLEEGTDGEWVVKGRLNIVININPDRKSSGQFDKPKLIGPFAEFGKFAEFGQLPEYGLQLDIITIVKAKKDDS